MNPLKSLLSAFVSALVLAGCVSGNKIRADADVISADVDRARRSGAERCAPNELATAEANLNFARGALSEGSSFRAAEHIRDAETAVKKALALSRDCGPKQVLVRATPPPMVVRIEETDRDGDGVPDNVDKCPTVPGPASNFGCPLASSSDRDGDGIPDSVDKCPDQPEDKDGFQDEDGCPEFDNDGDGLADTVDRCPNEAGPISNFGCPVHDRDGDGVDDSVDKCPDEPEDKDGFQDEDGCPDLDNDNDGVPDALDRCPNNPGPASNFGCPDPDRDHDGIPDRLDKCPDEPGSAADQGCPKQYKMVVIKKDRIEIKQQIRFKTNSAKIIGKSSTEILREVAQALQDSPQIKKIRIEGHTDSIGNESANLRLSQSRADAVKAALIRSGVDPVRMESVGYGASKPVASNATSRGRAENRRTEFNIVDP